MQCVRACSSRDFTAPAPGLRKVAMDPVCRIFGKKAGAVGARSQEMSKSYLAEPAGSRVAVADAVLVRDFDPGRSMTPALLRWFSMEIPRASEAMAVSRPVVTARRPSP